MGLESGDKIRKWYIGVVFKVMRNDGVSRGVGIGGKERGPGVASRGLY